MGASSSSPSSLTTTTSPHQSKKSVSFNIVNIRHFTVSMVGHTIPTTGGAPIGIVGEHINEETIDLDVFEASKPKRNRDELFVNRLKRTSFLLSKGFNIRQIGKQACICDEIRKERQANMKLCDTVSDISTTTTTTTLKTTEQPIPTNNNMNSGLQSITPKLFQNFFGTNKIAADLMQ